MIVTMKKMFIVGAFLCLSFMLYPDTLKWHVDVEYKNDEIVSVLLSSDLTMKVVDDALVFEGTDSNNSFALADISGFRYVKREVSGIQEVSSETFVVTADELQIVGLPDGTAVRVYDLKGVLVVDGKVDGVFRLTFDRLPGGVYIVNYGDVSRKIVVGKRER